MGCVPSTSRTVLAPPLAHDTSHHAEKLRRLYKSGVMIVMDAANVEIEGQKLSWELAHGIQGIDRSWRMDYANLLELIGKKGNLSASRRTIVAAHLVSSERQLIHQRYAPGRKTWQKLGITFTIPSSRNITGRQSKDRGYSPRGSFIDDAATRGEKAVDHTLVRIMTQEYEGLQLIHKNLPSRPHRTFALVAGDFDYVDVVDQARLSGCDVEIWYWTERQSMSNQWVREESRRHDSLGKLTFYDLREHFRFLTAPEETGDLLPGDKRERLSNCSEKSQDVAPPVQISGATGRRRFPRRGSMTAEGTPETPRKLTLSDIGGDISVRSLSSAASSRAPSSILAMHPADDLGNERCPQREFCRQEGCVLRHTEAERRHFALHGGRGRYRLVKKKTCEGGRMCEGNEERMGICHFLHDGEKRLCVNCLEVHEEKHCEVERERPINPLEARPLVQDGYLLDLLVTKGISITRDTEGKE